MSGIKLHKPIKKIDPAFEVKMPGTGKENLYEISVIVKGYNEETALDNFGNVEIYNGYFRISEVLEGEDEDGLTIFTPAHSNSRIGRTNGSAAN
tara:strand:- start:156 stop:437 length:282 start_codon:yes stop_codon:yes gene_type:complete